MKARNRVYFSLLKWLVFLSGIFILALGASLMIISALGAATWDVLHIGMSYNTPWSIGLCVQILGLFMVLFTYLIEKKRPRLGTFVNVILVGFFINLILAIPFFNGVFPLWERTTFLFLGVCLMGFGAGMYVASTLGAGPRDGLTLALAEKTGLSIRLVRSVLELLALTIGWLLGGPVAAGSFLSIILIGPVLQASLRFWRRRLSIVEQSLVPLHPQATERQEASGS